MNQLRLRSIVSAIATAYVATALCGLSGVDVHARIESREREPLIVEIDDRFSRWINSGYDTDSFELWKYTSSGEWELVPYQVDEYLSASSPDNLFELLDDPGLSNRILCKGTQDPPEETGPCEFRYDLRGTSAPGGILSDKDELVFIAGTTGRCDAPRTSWPSSSSHAVYRQKIIVTDSSESGCVFLYRRTSGSTGTVPDLIEYDTTGDGVPTTCVPHADACGAAIGDAYDFDSDGTDDIPSYRLDYLGNWAMDRMEIGTTTGLSANDILDINKTRTVSPTETERAWDQAEPVQGTKDTFGCALFEGFIDGPVRVIRVVQGAMSGLATRKLEYFYPGEYTARINLRVHQINGPAYQYFDLDESVVSPSGTPASVYSESTHGSTAYDFIDGTVSMSLVQPDPKEWYQVSSVKGSVLVFEGPDQPGKLIRDSSGEPQYEGRYVESTAAAWTIGFPAEYDDETGERAAFRTDLPRVTGGLPGSQNLEECEDPWGDNITIIQERTTVFLDGASASGSAGADEVARRDRGAFGVAVVEEQKNGGGPGPGSTCLVSLNVSYGHDGGPVTITPTGCSNAIGWFLYQEMGGGVRKRLVSLPWGESYADVNLSLDEYRTYSASGVDEEGAEGSLSSTISITYDDTVAPSPPSTLTATANGLTIEVAWEVPTTPDVAGYRVLVGTTSGGPYTQTHSTTLSAMKQDWDFTVSASGTYYVVVHSRDHAGNESAASSELTVVVP